VQRSDQTHTGGRTSVSATQLVAAHRSEQRSDQTHTGGRTSVSATDVLLRCNVTACNNPANKFTNTLINLLIYTLQL